MPITPEQFDHQLTALRERLVEQGNLVVEIVDGAFNAIYAMDSTGALALLEREDQVDRADVEIERDAVDLLMRVTKNAVALSEPRVRSMLTCVKVNNELERIADAASSIARRVVSLGDRDPEFPKSTRVMTNSVVGILRDTVRAFESIDPIRAKSVLAAEGTVIEFYDLVVQKSEQRIADARLSVEHAFELHAIIHQAVLMADHCTNIAEQIIYESTGAIVRHTNAGWAELDLDGNPEPDDDSV